SPPGISALLSRLRELAVVETDLTALDGQVDEYLQRVEEGLSERPDVAEMVRNIEANEDSGENPTGAELAPEIERVLRQQGRRGRRRRTPTTAAPPKRGTKTASRRTGAGTARRLTKLGSRARGPGAPRSSRFPEGVAQRIFPLPRGE